MKYGKIRYRKLTYVFLLKITLNNGKQMESTVKIIHLVQIDNCLH
jgi:hypothetical protein